MGAAGESQNPDAPAEEARRTKPCAHFRDRFHIPVPDDKVEDVPYYHPGKDSPEVQYMLERRSALGGFLPQRRATRANRSRRRICRRSSRSPRAPAIAKSRTTMAFVRGMNLLLRDKQIGAARRADRRRRSAHVRHGRHVPPDRHLRAVRPEVPSAGRRPADVLPRRPERPGAAGRHHRARRDGRVDGRGDQLSASATLPMLPFYIYYSMFGFQRIGDLAWAAGDMRARGFLSAAPPAAPPSNGEGLQHEDGHSHLLSGAIPNCKSYDPTFSYEVAVVLQDGVRRMLQEQEDVLLLPHRDERELQRIRICRRAPRKASSRACTCSRTAGKPKKGEPRVQLLGSGTILREVIAAAELLEKDFGVTADIWSCPSFSELRRDGFDAERWNRLHPEAEQRVPYVTRPAAGPSGSGHRRHRLRARIRGPDPRLHAGRHALHRAGHRRFRSFATRVRTCVGSSKSTVTGSRTPRSPRWRRKAR